MHIIRSRSRVLAAVFIVLALAANAFAGDAGPLLTGKWKMTLPARDSAGSPCPFVPEMMEFFGDGTMTMSNMPGNRVPFKTDLAADERQAMEARDPSLKGRNLLLVKPMPQMECDADRVRLFGYPERTYAVRNRLDPCHIHSGEVKHAALAGSIRHPS